MNDGSRKNNTADKQPDLGLKKIAFVAMPFRVKPTGLAADKGPAQIDFDALWHKAIYPAMEALDYLPIRADNQTGSVIIKDMLEQLVFADLVLADITIPNGNVYYEAGVRHAARESGCILISSEWAESLFDLGQITQLRYPYPKEQPTDTDYQKITDQLVGGIPNLVKSIGPVFTLTTIDKADVTISSGLKENSTQLFEFQTKLRAAQLKAEGGNKAPLRALAENDKLAQLPMYALEELVQIVRDYLKWGELMILLERLPEDIQRIPYFLEQKAHAMSKRGKPRDAVALLETIVEEHGESPERLGTIGGRYRELAQDEPNKQRKKSYQNRAIEAYRRGAELDLNQFYCAYKLVLTLNERGRKKDTLEATKRASLVQAATERAQALKFGDEWLDSTLVVHAFVTQDYDNARQYADKILDQGWPNWRLVALSQDLQSALKSVSEDCQGEFQEILEDVHSSLPVTQKTLMELLLPLAETDGGHYRKYRNVNARSAIEGEKVISITADGEETVNFAKADDMVVKNLTESEEKYIVGKEKFAKLYQEIEKVDDTWKLYRPQGEVRAIEITRDITSDLDVGEEFFVIAPWNAEQLAREGDMFVVPLPARDEIYRIARKEFDETYKLVS